MMPDWGCVRVLAAAAAILAACLVGSAGAEEAAKPMYWQDWHVLGPFPNEDNKGFATVHPPEKEVDLEGWYTGIGGASIRWQHIGSPGATGDRPVDLRGALHAKAAAESTCFEALPCYSDCGDT